MAFDMISKVIGIILCFVFLAVGPILLKQQKIDNLNNRKMLNEMEYFLDTVADSSEITDFMLQDFYLACAETGWTVDVDITRRIKIINPDGSGGTRITWLISDDNMNYNKGDSVTVRVRALDYSSGQKLSWLLAKVNSSKFDVNLTRSIRN